MINRLDDLSYFTACVEAQCVMGHVPPNGVLDVDRRTILSYDWNVDQVRQALHVPLNETWSERILTLEMQGLASFAMCCAPVYRDEHGVEQGCLHWEDEPRDTWGDVSVHPDGVLRLAEWYGRPYVRCHESPAVLAHGRLVQAETRARMAQPIDEARWAREWPERYAAFQAFNAKYWADREQAERDQPSGS